MEMFSAGRSWNRMVMASVDTPVILLYSLVKTSTISLFLSTSCCMAEIVMMGMKVHRGIMINLFLKAL